jgi:hypothetical protein
MKNLGFEFQETMAGSFRESGRVGDDKPIEFTVRVRAADSHDFAQNGVATMEGEVTAEGLADAQPLEGTLDMGALRRRRLPYEFAFKGNDGRSYRFSGAKRVRLLDLLRTMSTLPAAIYDDAGKEFARCELRFDYRSDMWNFLRSFKLRRRR